MTIIKGNRCDWEVVIGLEVHAQVISNSKLFSGASTKTYDALPNTQVALFDVAMPGMLPVLNEYCVYQAIKTGIALSCKINKYSAFDRKNYFYPDLPSGYQITQFYYPIATEGKIVLEDHDMKEIRIARIHLEQDAGKSIHEFDKTYIDFNRAGVALMEIVSEPDFRSIEEVAEYLKKLRMILRFIETCDGDMEKGSLRCDANVSVKPVGSSELGIRSEIKNLNSIRYVMQAIEYEANRQVNALENGEIVTQNTLLFDVTSGQTRVIRTKEDAHDYRYFPDPDLFPLKIDDQYIDHVRSSLPELPMQKRERYTNDFSLSKYDADILSSDKDVAIYFEKVAEKHDGKLAASWITGELFGRLNRLGITIGESSVTAEDLIQLLDLIVNNTISGKIAKQVFDMMFESGKSPALIVSEHGLKQVSDENALSVIVERVLKNNASKVVEYKQGKEKLFGYFVGQVMKETQGKANPDMVNSIIKQQLEN
ncbi:aspartyl/glutamyl-tRNA(Asn/Gln) amidotransferase, B subunit [Ehrlichia chaffeensis str. Heartland]|uniref:Aspartyl/glutamyl-tRNA(Asn/Gln) amidotransferase subunit B n=1 Tax=Ehrlichia chaffeensis (strain ATCC CRL-10679 / Arkansas) TaxID=205920 RepID=GATB_EHRCR|nr:Asp-tRNA(Asn)/Glu-tRNA(Gln) amidotransferase subunit GatB [Ehrlichia chaffeensis]Q2GG24.1 RecName: Full=Aspartyl/glutamyl-tRNA(Asn/Gln) amidotransferase subunit B; Short=Asp/Glu-ADT subunit B [Ehrlichia chaffeensis str. Arkansas]ABD44987.1 glutamyl-tRNA(Gln) amidotransferase, B subunit [Ehrlichia chaffeensis str. Arkansas]AHX03868.1 aspartyl/glutamyl-tRNA(Asn/Gln) amidotransferase, B subunit [Ehrlichia chaffeensis str. Heartland]AHX05406.1 aspartyl/glutamyl-tRNA(Asn/Gln) amidotransferase, B 